MTGLTARTDWSRAAEVTFECEPGTLSESKLAAIRDFGVTRLSLGVENFDDRILEQTAARTGHRKSTGCSSRPARSGFRRSTSI